MSDLKEYTSTGRDQADFLFSANKQIAPENLARIASGGELSRVMLCLKSLLTKNNNLPTIIFDEIDSGVSGEVADKVGQILSSNGEIYAGSQHHSSSAGCLQGHTSLSCL